MSGEVEVSRDAVFSLGIPVILVIVALIIFGPKRLPELGEGLGKAIKEFRKATTEMGDSLREEGHKPDTATGTTYPAPVEPATPPPVAATPPPEAPRS